ncbi:AAA family ATPase [Streptomyces sp. NPDC057271]|uniref:AAA family ATPase n=1 Tax=unclassified Streptomyces TaxID=2593676 RepID=UPI00363A2F31
MLYVITGPPASGKSSYVQSHAKASDIVIDLDVITRALSGPGAPQWSQDPIVLRVAHRARFAAIEEAIAQRDKVDVWLIHTQPSPKALVKYKRLDAQIVTVDPGQDIVMQRIEAMRDPDMRRVATRWYRHRPQATRESMPQASRPW